MNTAAVEIPDTLKKIVAYKVKELRERMARIPLRELREGIKELPATRGFATALRRSASSGEIAIIAEVKKGSPSKGLIRADFNPVDIARTYELNGATCLSVLTEEHFFMGSLDYLRRIRDAVSLPLLRKDFIIDAYQIYEARIFGADAILLITAILDFPQIVDFMELARELLLDVLLEVHNEEEMAVALRAGCALIGVNNRDLRTFKTDLDTTRRLADMVPSDRFLVAESGIFYREDIEHLRTYGAGAFLIGESLMRERDIGAKLKELRGY